MSEPTGPAWEPKIIGARELWAIRESFKFCDTTQISDAVLDTMVNIMDGTTDPDEWIPEPRYPYQGLRIVRVDDLRALANAMIALRTEWVSANINRHIDRMEGEIKSSQLDELIEAKTNQWNELFPDRVALIDRIQAAIGEAE